MGKTGNSDVWINLSLNDLKCARILYEQNEFRNSYYLFQQATEKASKACALKFESATEDDIQKMKHDVFKHNKLFATKRIQQIKKILKELEADSSKLRKEYEKMKKGLTELELLKSKDLVNLSSEEIDSLYDEVIAIRKPFAERNPEVVKSWKALGFISDFLIDLLQITLDKAFIKLSISVCGILTMQHNTSTRYPDSLKDPTVVYTLKLPIIKKQPLLMNLLEDVVNKMKDFCDKKRHEQIFDKLTSNFKI